MLANHALRDKKVILFYFTARFAAKDFTPYLKEAYDVSQTKIFPASYTLTFFQASRVKDQGAGVEVIFVSNVRYFHLCN